MSCSAYFGALGLLPTRTIRPSPNLKSTRYGFAAGLKSDMPRDAKQALAWASVTVRSP